MRINPYEVHINDSEYIDEVYPGAQIRTMKYGWAVREFGLKYAGFATESHELHRIRRSAVAHYFSKASLQRLEPGIQSVIDKLMGILNNLKGSGKVINLIDMYACLTGDIISRYAYAKELGFLDDPDFSPWWHKLIMEVSINGHFMKQFPWMLELLMSLPKSVVEKMNPLMGSLIEFQLVSHRLDS